MDSVLPVAITAVVTLFATVFGREFLGQYFLGREQRSTDVVSHLIGVHEKTTDAWINLATELSHQNTRATTALTSMAERIYNHEKDEDNRFQFTRSTLEELCEGMERIEDSLALISKRNGRSDVK
jgi:hypothetical protein